MGNALVVYVGGVPAAGKSTLFKGLRSVLFRDAKAFSVRTCKGVAAGRYRMLGVFDGSVFEGTDKLSMAVIDDALAYIDGLNREPERTVVFVEGDRLLCDRFIRATGARLVILSARPEVLAQRRLAREKGGCHQTETFWRAKATKIQNMLDKWHAPVWPSNTNGEQANNLQRLVVMARRWVEG